MHEGCTLLSIDADIKKINDCNTAGYSFQLLSINKLITYFWDSRWLIYKPGRKEGGGGDAVSIVLSCHNLDRMTARDATAPRLTLTLLGISTHSNFFQHPSIVFLFKRCWSLRAQICRTYQSWAPAWPSGVTQSQFRYGLSAGKIRRSTWWRRPHWLVVTVEKHGIIPIDRGRHCVKKKKKVICID